MAQLAIVELYICEYLFCLSERALRETRESAGAPGVRLAVGDVTPDVTSECDA